MTIRLSSQRGESTPALLQESLGACLDRIAESHPTGLALVSRHEKVSLTFLELCRLANDVAAGLIARGARAGDRVAVWAGNRAASLVTLYGAAKAGLVFVPIGAAFSADECLQVVRDVNPIIVMAARRSAHDLELLADALSGPSKLADGVGTPTFHGLIALDSSPGGPWSGWDVLSQATGKYEDERRVRQEATTPAAAAIILYTSGTTGQSKGAVLSHRMVVNGGYFVGVRLAYTAADRVCLPLPLSHALGCIAGCVAALTHASTVVFPSETFDVARTLEAVAAERCTSLYGTPTMFLAHLRHPALRDEAVGTLRTGIVSGAVCPPDVLRRIVTDMHMPQVAIGYGMTEMGPILYTAIDDPLELRIGTAGAVQPHVECKVVDRSSRRTVPRGARGELCARGYCVMEGYWRDPAATAAALDAEGWMYSGDLAVMADNGRVAIVGRLKDLIVRGGENVSPLEVEEVLRSHPDVCESYVVSVPDDEYGEEICAWICARPGVTIQASELRRHCRRRLAAFKVPRFFCFTEAFPMTPTGKVQRYRLRDIAVTRLGLPRSHSV